MQQMIHGFVAVAVPGGCLAMGYLQISGSALLLLLIIFDAFAHFWKNEKGKRLLAIAAISCFFLYWVFDTGYQLQEDERRADRQLSPSQLAAIRPLAKYHGQPFIVRAEWNDPEADKFAENIADALIKECGWSGHTVFMASLGQPGPGISVGVGKKDFDVIMSASKGATATRPYTNQMLRVTGQLSHALEDAGVYTMGMEIGGGVLKPDPDVPAGTVVIDVGRKRQ